MLISRIKSRIAELLTEACGYSPLTKVISEEEVNRILAEEEKTGGWIPVTERLPEDDIDVLVWYEYYRYGNYNRLYQTIGISYTYDGKWSGFVDGQSGWKQLRIIAWMPLPEPYKEREE